MDLLLILFNAIFANAGGVAGLSLAILPFLGIPGPLRDPDPDPGGGGGGDDPPLNEKQTAAITKLITDQVNGAVSRIEKTVIPGALKGINTGITELKTTLEGLKKPTDPPTDPPDPKLDKVDPQIRAAMEAKDRKVAKLEKDFGDLQNQLKDAEGRRQETERAAAIRTEIAKYRFRDDIDDAPDQVFSIVQGQVRRADDGSLIAGPEGSELPLPDYVKAYFDKSGKVFLAPAGSGGSGNRPGERNGSKGTVMLEDLVPGKMTADQEKAALAELQKVMPR